MIRFRLLCGVLLADCVGHVQVVKPSTRALRCAGVFSCADRAALRAGNVCHVSAEVRHRAGGRVWALDNGAVMDDPADPATNLGSELYFYGRMQIADHAVARRARKSGRVK